MSTAIVQGAKCKCGGFVKLATAPKSVGFTRLETREFAKLMEDGYKIVTLSLKKAIAAKLCFGSCGKMVKL